MKKLLTISGLALCFMLISSSVSAQQNYNYRSGSAGISVATDENGDIYSVAYLDKAGNWQEGTITEFIPDEDGATHFNYRDNSGTLHSIYYDPTTDQVVVTRFTDAHQWVMQREH